MGILGGVGARPADGGDKEQPADEADEDDGAAVDDGCPQPREGGGLVGAEEEECDAELAEHDRVHDHRPLRARERLDRQEEEDAEHVVRREEEEQQRARHPRHAPHTRDEPLVPLRVEGDVRVAVVEGGGDAEADAHEHEADGDDRPLHR